MKRKTTAVPLTPEEAEKKTRYLYWWLLLAVFFEYARPGAFVPIPGQVNSLIPLALLGVSSFAQGLRPLRDIFRDRMAKWLLIFLTLIFLSVLHAEVTFNAYNIFTGTLGYFFLFILLARILTTRGRVIGLFLMLGLSHLFLLIMNPDVVLDPDNRHYVIGGTFLGDGNDFSLSLCVLIPMCLELAFTYKGFVKKVLAWLLFVITILAVIGTSSRGATLGMIGVFGYLWLRTPRKMLTLFGILVVAGGVMLYAPPLYFERMGTIKNYEDEGSAQGRITAWKSSIRMATDHPIGGVSAGHFAISFGTKYKPPGETGPWLTAHSMYFLVLGELGLPGLFTLLVLVFGAIRESGRVTRAVKARAGPNPTPEVKAALRLLMLTSASMVGFSIAGAFLSVAYYPHIFVLTAVMIAARWFALQEVALQPEDLRKVTGGPRRPRKAAGATPPAGSTAVS